MDSGLGMMVTIAAIVFFSAIALLFAQEFGRIFGKLFAIRGMKLWLPLIVGSYILEIFEIEFRWLLWLVGDVLHHSMQNILSWLPFKAEPYWIQILTLFVMGSFPAWIVWFKLRRKRIAKIPRVTYYFGIVFWIVTVFLITVQPALMAAGI